MVPFTIRHSVITDGKWKHLAHHTGSVVSRSESLLLHGGHADISSYPFTHSVIFLCKEESMLILGYLYCHCPLPGT